MPVRSLNSRWPSICAAALLAVLTLAAPATVFGQRLNSSLFKDGSELKRAFRPVVADAREYTTRIFSRGRGVAVGCIVRPNGWVVSKASELRDDLVCHLSDGRELPARIVQRDEEHDLALLKIEARGLPTVEWRENHEDIAGGQWVVTPGIGVNPLAIGVISGPVRKVPRLSGFLGVMLQNTDDRSGVRIEQVVPRTAAHRAGMMVDDVVTHIDGERVRERDELSDELASRSPGTRIQLKVLRDGDERTLRATLGARGESSRSRRRQSSLSSRRSGFPATFQHDCVLNPSECGGAILDITGKAVGINIARADRTGSYAIPAKAAIERINVMIEESVEIHTRKREDF